MNFNADVLAQSHQLPVVVDFWAPWCGPCRVLGPVIEQLEIENQGTWKLVKINTEEAQELALEYGIRSIPNVKMFYKGEVIAEFAGALPRHQIQQWLNEYLPSEEKKEWAATQELLSALPEVEKEDHLRRFLAKYMNHRDASLELAKILAFKDPEQASRLVQFLKMGDPEYDTLTDLRHLVEWSNLDDQNHGGLSEELMKAYRFLKENDLEKSVEAIIDVVKKDKSIHQDLPRKAGIAIFRLLGNQHPVTKKYRRLFDMAMY